MGYPVYPESRNSEVPWLGKIPAHWELKRLRFALQTNPSPNEISLEQDAPVSFIPMDAVGESGGLRLDTDKALSEIGSGYTYFADGDVVVAKITPCFENGKGAIAEGLTNGIAFGTTELHVLRANSTLDKRFLFHLTTSQTFHALGEAEMYGAGGQKRVPDSFIKNFRAALPTLPEQQTIARFLDHKTAQIDALIAKKEALLQKLAEKRTALISQAVTQGLDPTVPMQDSGVAWLGKIPEGWKQVSLARAIAKIEQGWSPSCEERIAASDEWGVLKSGCVNGGVFRESDHKTLPTDIAPPKALEVKAGDILMCRASGSKHLIGSVAEVKTCRPQLIFSDKTYRITLNASLVTSEFFTLAMGSRYLRDQIELSISGADGLANNIPQSSVKAYRFLAPPLAVQQELVSSLSARLAPMAKTELLVRNAIDKLKEYRAALITAAVTGKIDVRDVPLPAEVSP